MASPVNRHCANCIGALSFPIKRNGTRHAYFMGRRSKRYSVWHDRISCARSAFTVLARITLLSVSNEDLTRPVITASSLSRRSVAVSSTASWDFCCVQRSIDVCSTKQIRRSFMRPFVFLSTWRRTFAASVRSLPSEMLEVPAANFPVIVTNVRGTRGNAAVVVRLMRSRQENFQRRRRWQIR